MRTSWDQVCLSADAWQIERQRTQQLLMQADLQTHTYVNDNGSAILWHLLHSAGHGMYFIAFLMILQVWPEGCGGGVEKKQEEKLDTGS